VVTLAESVAQVQTSPMTLPFKSFTTMLGLASAKSSWKAGIMIHSIKKRALSTISKIASASDKGLRRRQNTDLYLSAVLPKIEGISDLNDPTAYVDLLRGCIEAISFPVTEVKASNRFDDDATRRFNALIDALRSYVPPIPIPIATKLAAYSDRLRGSSVEDRVAKEWLATVAFFYALSGSDGHKCRLLFSAIRFMKSRRLLELGTSYGMSASTILEAATDDGEQGTVTTVEITKSTFDTTSPLLKATYGQRVETILGSSRNAIPAILRDNKSFDFMFHDAAHSHDDYVNDFTAIEPALEPGATVIVDDIRWNDPRFFKGDPRCYEGWQEVVKHPRVLRAVEVSSSAGILLLR
jgi:predicted O-methyltransferase YrrM